jgi:hypothetical protein
MERNEDNRMNYADIRWNDKMSLNEFDVEFIKAMFSRQDDVNEMFVEDYLQRIIIELNTQEEHTFDALKHQQGVVQTALRNQEVKVRDALAQEHGKVLTRLHIQEESVLAALIKQENKVLDALLKQQEKVLSALTKQEEKESEHFRDTLKEKDGK